MKEIMDKSKDEIKEIFKNLDVTDSVNKVKERIERKRNSDSENKQTETSSAYIL